MDFSSGYTIMPFLMMALLLTYIGYRLKAPFAIGAVVVVLVACVFLINN